MKIIFYQKIKLDECHMTISVINASCSGKGHPPPRLPPTLGIPLPAPWGPPAPLGDPPQAVQGVCPLPEPGRGCHPKT